MPDVLAVARSTDDRRLLGVCLDCFRAVLADSRSDTAREVARFLGGLLMDPAYRRIRPRILRTLIRLGPASRLVLPELVATYLRRGPSSLLVPARAAVVGIAWHALAEGSPAEQAQAVEAFERLGALGLLNLRYFLSTRAPAAETRDRVEAAIERLGVKGRRRG